MSETDVGLSALPDGWMWTTLGEIIEPSKEKVNPLEIKEVPYISLEHIQRDTGKLLRHGSSIDVRSSKTKFTRGDLLYGKLRPYLNKVCRSDFEGVCSTDLLVFSKNELLSNTFFLYRFLCRDFVNYASHNASGVNLPRVNFQTLSQFKIPLPPFPEQHRIVAKIEELFTKLDAGKEELLQAKARLKRYRQSVLKTAMDGKLTEDWRKEHRNEIEPASILLDRILKERREKWEAEQLEQMMAKGKMPKDDKWKNKYKEPLGPDTSKLSELPKGWVWVTLPQIGELNRGKSKHRPRNASFLYGGRYPFVQTGDIKQANGLIGHYNQTYSEEGLKQSRLWPAGTLCITIAANIADTAILGFDACFPDSVVGFLSEIGQCNIRFVEFFLRTAKEDLERYAPATAQKNINLGTLKDLAIPFPPLAEQNVITEEIDRYLSVADAVEAVVDAELKRSDALRQSILKQAFSGKLVPQDPNDEPAEKLLERIKKEKTKREAVQKTNSKTKKQLALFEH